MAPYISITSHLNNDVVYFKNINSTSTLTISGTWSNREQGGEHTTTITVEFGGVISQNITQNDNSWKAIFSQPHFGDNQQLKATITFDYLDERTAEYTETKTINISIRLLNFSFVFPGPGRTVVGLGEDRTIWEQDVNGNWFEQKMQFKLSDPNLVGGATWTIDSISNSAIPDVQDKTLWFVDSRNLDPSHINQMTLLLKAGKTDGGNRLQESIIFEFKDFTPPKYEITFPKDGHRQPPGVPLKCYGISDDIQSAVAELRWSLDGGTYTTIKPPNKNGGFHWDWSFDLPPLTTGLHSITALFKDGAGNETPLDEKAVITFEVAEVYHPQDANDLVSLRAYLEDLLRFSRLHINKVVKGNPATSEGQIMDEDLAKVFHQPFKQLADTTVPTSREPLNQLRAAIEILRRYNSDLINGAGHRIAKLITYWPCDEGSGTRITDNSGHGYNATVTADMWATGRSGSSLTFNGVDSVVKIPKNKKEILVSPCNNFTVSFWAKPNSETSITIQTEKTTGMDGKNGQHFVWGPLEGKSILGTSANAGAGISLGNNGIAVYEYSENYLPPRLVVPWVVSTWIHVALVYKQKQPNLYIDGKLVGTGEESPKKSVYAMPEAIGGINYGYYTGQLDEVRIFDEVLSDAEIALLASIRVPTKTQTGSVATESDYRQAAYEAILSRLSTSYDEIRLVHGATKEVRDALALRLGITLDPANDQLNKLYLMPDKATETDLETLFGIPDTRRDPLTNVPAALLHQWQSEHLRNEWRKQDDETFSVPDAETPIIDPDCVRSENLRNPQVGDTVYDLWTNRADWLNTKATAIRKKYDINVTSEKNLDVLFQFALNKKTLAMFDKLVERGKDGENIASDLVNWKLSMDAFKRLERLRALAATNAVTESEWEDIYSILLQTTKRGEYKAWRTEETDKKITLSPDYFMVSATPRSLPAWRATYQQYLDWQDRVQSRIDQEASLRDAQAAAIIAADQIALPVLRDALVGDWVERLGVHPSDAAEFFSGRLLVDVKVSGSQQTTRMLQAIETIQNVLFTLRSQQIAPGNPISDWKLAYQKLDAATGKIKVVECEPSHFAGEWQWMSSYDGWRGAMLVTFFPELVVMPGLRPASEQTQAFRELVSTLRARNRHSRETARAAVKAYQKAVCGLVVHLPLDEGAGDYATDASENGNSATVNNAIWSTGEIAGSICLNGKAYLKIAPSASLELGQNDTDFSVSFWFYLREGFTKEWRTVMHKGTTNDERTFAIFMNPENNHFHYRISTTANPNDGGDSKTDIPLNTWIHVEYRKTGNNLQLYLDDVLDSEIVLDHPVKENNGPIYIGRPDIAGYPGLSASFAIKNMQIYNYNWVTAQVTFTDEHTDKDLGTLRKQNENLLKPYFDKNQRPPYSLQELLYYVPLEAFLTFLKSRDYNAALDWIETVFAYKLPPAEQKIYYGLQVEQNLGDLPERTAHWLLDGLNPHTIAALRHTSNTYTRFTLISLARCFLEFGEAEHTLDTGPSLARANGLYQNARNLLLMPDFDPPIASTRDNVALPNPVVEALRLQAELQLNKLRQGRNIAGMKRQVELPASRPTDSGLPQLGSGGQLVIPGAMQQLRPTPYHFRVLLERSKQLAAITQQMESAFLYAMEKRDPENYNLLKAGYDLQLAQAGIELQGRRKVEAEKGTTLAELQRDRSKIQQVKYQEWIDAGLNDWENQMITNYRISMVAQSVAVGANMIAQVAQLGISAAGPYAAGLSSIVSLGSASYGVGALASIANIDASTTAQIAAIKASQERRQQEWELQKSLADQDWKIGDQQHLIALQHEQVVQQEGEIARIQSNEAQAVANYLARKFTNAELYDWMSRVLGRIYSYFLQQTTSIAQLAQNQLAFERQETSIGLIQADYWQAPSEGGSNAQNAPDRQGLTGSARLLQDITKLDQYAFETDKRKLNLSQTFSLAQITPYELNLFRQSGVLPFTTSMLAFDQEFPGHYLRLIKRVRVSVVALIPPIQGIRATLIASGISHVVTGGDVFQEIVIRRDPELVALTSPISATGVFELDTQSEMLLPFEAMGVATTWEFQLPKAANMFDFNTIADVLVTIEYTALNSFDYRDQVIQRLNPKVSADRAFSLRDTFPDQWYDLHNPDDPATPLTISFDIDRSDFPPNLIGSIDIQHILLSFIHANDVDEDFLGPRVELEATLSMNGGNAYKATPVDSTISTRRANGNTWIDLTGATKSPAGKWTLTLPKEANAYFKEDKIQDILLVITFTGRTPPWPT